MEGEEGQKPHDTIVRERGVKRWKTKSGMRLKGILVSLLIFSVQLYYQRVEQNTPMTRVLTVTFGSGFAEDRVSVSIDSCRIAEEEIINTHLIDDVTRFQFMVNKTVEGYEVSVLNKNKYFCELKNGQQFEILISLNNVDTTFIIDVANGRYLVVNKNMARLNNIQSFTQPVFD